MESIDHLRHYTEEHVDLALLATGVALPIADAATLSIVLGRMLGGPVTEDDVGRALDGAYVSLSIESTAALLEAFNRHLDIVSGEIPVDEDDEGDEEGPSTH